MSESKLATHNTNIAIAGASMLAAALSSAIDGDDWEAILSWIKHTMKDSPEGI